MKSVADMVAAYLCVLGVLLGMLGTYLMTSAYHPFPASELLPTIVTVLWRFITFRRKAALELVRAVARAGDKLHTERKDLSLLGIIVLFAGFFVQAAGALLALWGAYHKSYGFPA